MSFGWSAGDIVAAANLVNRIIKSLGNVGGAQEHFQELETELLSLSKALHEIRVLTSEPGQIPEIVALKFAACLCEDTLKRFHEKIKPFDATLSIEAESGMRKGKTVPKMVRWELLVKKDIPELRSYLVAHVGSLTLRLNTALLKVASRSLINATQNSATLQDHLHIETHSICEKINLISQGDTIPRLDSLLTIATQVWKSQCEMIEKFSTVLRKLPDPDIRHTWAQAPVRFEDALGRVIPIPSEYDWDKVEAVIHAQFKRGPGNQKVRSREYELYDGTFADIAIIKEQNFCPIPGMSIVMAFILGQYAGSEYCPRLGCKSKSFKRQGISTETTVWQVVGVLFLLLC
ncbi:hypothetical protein BKA65DRAFT_516763 [Rhexocercosporidium sp. MPI-PUGE-AT-0058]|nr:hypothetical protein BKA65DRAFT_516763 [Rhexocercosporidium sp. MPI-PUGE-AT-0058]